MKQQHNLYDIMKTVAQDNASSACIFDVNGNFITYEELATHIESTTAFLRNIGIKRNDRIAIVLPNGPEMATAFLSVSCAATSAPLNPTYREQEYEFYLTDLQAKAIIVLRGENSPATVIARKLKIHILQLEIGEKPGLFRLFNSSKENELSHRKLDFCQSEDIALVLHTSGTTSRPKIVPLSQHNICTSATNIRNTLRLHKNDRCLNIMPLFHIHGLMGVLLSSMISGASVCCTTGFDARQFFSWLQIYRPTWYSAVPTMHQAILGTFGNDTSKLQDSQMRFIRSSSSSLPPSVLQQLEDTFSVPVVESYGMTEASHQMTSNPLPPEERKPGSVGVPAGPQVAIMDRQGNLLPPKTEGEIVIRGENVTNGYENNTEANSSSFTNGWFRTGDIGFFDQDNYLFIKGRVKEIINRGGEKISPREVDEVLLQHPGVRQAVTFAVSHPRLGEDVAAAVILHKNTDISEQQIRHFAFEYLADFKVPSQIIFVDKIPLGPTGKMQRIGLAKKLEHRLQKNHSSPVTNCQKIVQKIWFSILEKDSIGIDDNFFALGGDSLLGMQVIHHINTHFNTNLRAEKLFFLPTIRQLSLFIETCDTQQQDIISEHRAQKAPLSFAQEIIWHFEYISPDVKIYNRPSNIHLYGALDTKLLHKSLVEIVTRHSILRSSLKTTHRSLEQQVQTQYTLELPLVNLQKLSEQQKEQQTRQIISQQVRDSFNLQHPLKMRAQLVKYAVDHHLLLLTFHHVAFDAESESILFRDLSVIYNAFAKNKKPSLPNLPVQYKDFSVWQRQRDFSAQLRYWKHKLQNSPEFLEISPKQRPQKTCHREDVIPINFTEEICNRVRETSKENNVTSFMVLFAAYTILLSKYSNQRDIIVGVPFSDRNHQVENSIGVFVSTLLLRVNVSPQIPVKDFLQQINTTTVEALTHRTPLQKILEVANVQRSNSYNPLYQALFIFEKTSSLPKIEGVRATTQTTHIGDVATDLLLEISVDGNQLRGYLKYRRDVFPPKMMQRFASHYLNIVAQTTRDTSKKIGGLNLVCPGEQQQIAENLSNIKPKTEYKELLFHVLVEKQAQKIPDHVALVDRDTSMTYQQLDRESNKIARLLSKENIRSGQVVAVLLERSFEVFTTLLATAKLGAVYVPIDEDFPKQRIQYILENSNAQILLTSPPHLNTYNIKSINIKDKQIFMHLSHTTIDSKINIKNLAYIIYTSGSTGKPKGVQAEHRHLMTYVQDIIEFFDLEPCERYAMTQSISFDPVFINLAALITGKTIHIISKQQAIEPQSFSDYIQKNAIDVLHSTPQHFAKLYAYSPRIIPNKVLIIGGESSLWHWAQKIVQEYRGTCRIFNHYGPTETTVGVTSYLLKPSDTTYTTVPIGKPQRNAEIHILDNHLYPVPIGVVGELYVAGSIVTRGYWNNPRHTAEKFVPDPHHLGKTMYRSGDRARWLEDGNIEFLGRDDDQVKIRGFRVELGEIEANLRENIDIENAVVLTREMENGEKQLIAYIVTKSHKELPLKSWLRDRLPEYMIPHRFIFLENLPLESSGKLNRASLPQPQTKMTMSTDPRNDTEKHLVNIWRETLHNDYIGIEDNFFELGGHSLLAITIIGQIKEKLKRSIPVRDFFEKPTIRRLAEFIHESEDKTSSIVAQQKQEYELSSAQQRLWFLNLLEPNSPVYNMSFVRELHGEIDRSVLSSAWEKLVQRQSTLRTYFHVKSDVMQRICDRKIHLEFFTAPSYEHAQTIVENVAQKPFCLTDFPLTRCALVTIRPDHHILCITSHHIISDFWSMRILWSELIFFYNNHKQKTTQHLPPLEVTYGDFCEWQRHQDLQDQERFWLQTFSHAIPTLTLPTDFVRPPRQNYQGNRYAFDISNDLNIKLQQLAKDHDCSLFMVILSAFNILLYRYSGESDIAIGFPIAGRHHGQIERNVGLFLNTLVVRTQLDNSANFLQLLSQVKSMCLQTYTHQDYPFERLVEKLNPPRSTSHNPLFQVMVNMMEDRDDTDDFIGVKSEKYRHLPDTTKFDITLYVTQSTHLEFVLSYRSDLFRKTTIERMAKHFVMLLEAITIMPLQPLSRLQILTTDEKQLLVESNNTSKKFYSEHTTVYHKFDQQVQKTPDNIAVVCREQHISYIQLQNKANQLANHLQKQSIGLEDIVVICVSRSIEMIAAILAVGKVGAAYVFLDVQNPLSRLQTICGDIQASVLIAQKDVVPQIAQEFHKVVFIDDESIYQNFAVANITPQVTKQNAMYLSYTSGSTGTPKGVIHTHQAVVNGRNALQENYPLNENDVILQLTSLAFDPGVRDIFVPLTVGATIVIVPQVLEINTILQNITKHKVTAILSIVPSFLDFLVESIENSSLRLILCQGEALSNALRDKVFAKLASKIQLINQYGVTENSFAATHYHVTTKDNVSIGTPTYNTQVYVLDPCLNRCPVGVPGEIYIAGKNLARGYLRDSKLSASRFVPNPFTKKIGTRMYKTGDIGKLVDNGSIEISGRRDTQVKILGTRIELQEICNALKQYHNIQNCAVIFRNLQVIAFYQSENNIDEQSLRNYMRNKLPEIMIPKVFVHTKKIPLLANGKTDLRALYQLKSMQREKTPPHTDIQKQIAAIWQDILQVESIAIDDDFFALGGHSLLAVRAVSQIRPLFGFASDDHDKLPLSIILTHATIRQFINAVQQINTTLQQTIIPMNTKVDDRNIFLVHAANVDPICYQHLSSFLDGKSTVFTIRTHDLPADTSIEKTASYHYEKIKTVQECGPYIIGGMCLGGMVAFELARQLQQQGDEVQLIFMMDTINIPGMQNYKSQLEHQNKKRRRQKHLQKAIQFWQRLFCGDVSFVRQKITKVVHSLSIKRKLNKLRDPQIKLRKKMRKQLRLIRDQYTPSRYPGEVVYICSEKEQTKYAQKRLQELANKVNTHKIQGSLHSDVSRPYFAQRTSEIVLEYLD